MSGFTVDSCTLRETEKFAVVAVDDEGKALRISAVGDCDLAGFSGELRSIDFVDGGIRIFKPCVLNDVMDTVL